MLSKIRLELARTKEFPSGSSEIGYEFTAPLDGKGHIDADLWHQSKDHCRVRRFRPDEEDDVGHLIRKPGGSWAFHYDIQSDEEGDESGYRFNAHVFMPGEYVSLTEDDELVTYRVVRVEVFSTSRT
jgi:hypothetical protein